MAHTALNRYIATRRVKVSRRRWRGVPLRQVVLEKRIHSGTTDQILDPIAMTEPGIPGQGSEQQS